MGLDALHLALLPFFLFQTSLQEVVFKVVYFLYRAVSLFWPFDTVELAVTEDMMHVLRIRWLGKLS